MSATTVSHERPHVDSVLDEETMMSSRACTHAILQQAQQKLLSRAPRACNCMLCYGSSVLQQNRNVLAYSAYRKQEPARKQRQHRSSLPPGVELHCGKSQDPLGAGVLQQSEGYAFPPRCGRSLDRAPQSLASQGQTIGICSEYMHL